MIYDNMLQLIGQTPIVRYKTVNGNELFFKLEMFNPAGSVKDRIALSMINALERDGRLSPKVKIVEATSGNTGIGLAFVLAHKGIHLTLIMPENASKERVDLMKAYGAAVILTPAAAGIAGARQKAQELVETNGYLHLEQFANPHNPEAHMLTTAEEIKADFPTLDYIVLGVGTGGTITGLGRILKPHYETIRFIAVEPDESAVLSGEKRGSHGIAGIGPGFVPDILDRSFIDELVRIKTDAAFDATRRLARAGYFFGISGGAAVLASEQLAHRVNGKKILTIIPDGGIKYMSTGVFNEK